MNQSDLTAELKAAMDRKGIIYRDIRALILAFAAQESFIGGGLVSALAWKYRNPFGMKWDMKRDAGRYESTKLPGNKFDQADGLEEIQYRVYTSFDQAVEVFMKNIFASDNEQRRKAFQAFLSECADSWCQNNPDHKAEVLQRFKQIREGQGHE